MEKGKFKTDFKRDKVISLRFSQDELDYLDRLCASRKSCNAKLHSRSDVIMLSIKFALGELSLLDRMEMNLMEGKSLFDTANYKADGAYSNGNLRYPQIKL